jgi:hypothetical protein
MFNSDVPHLIRGHPAGSGGSGRPRTRVGGSRGGATVAAGVFRRDHLLLTGPGFGGESWHNQVHDVVSGVAYAAMLALAAEVVLAAGLRYRGASAGPLVTAHLAANEANPSTSDSSTNSPRTGTAAPSSSSSGAKCRSTAS